MPWSEKDYPQSWKNFDEVTRRKAIDIGNALIAEGYDEDRAIPIATSKAKEWVSDATPPEKEELMEKNISKSRPKSDGAKYQDADVEVKYRDDEKKWEVISKGADKAEGLYDTKKEAQDRAKEMSEYREGDVISYNKDGKKSKE